MHTKAIVSSKGQVVIPKQLRNKLGLHSGSEMMIHLRNDRIIELKLVQRNLDDFFGMGAHRVKNKKMSIADIDKTIGKAVLKNDRG